MVCQEYGIESPAVYEPDPGYSTTYVLDKDYRVVGAHSEESTRVKEAPCR